MIPIKVNITYTAEDIQKAYMLHFNKKLPFKSRRNLFIALALIIIGVLIYYFDTFNGELNWICWACMGYGLALIVLYYYKILTIGKKYFKKLPEDKNLFPYTFSDEGITFQGEKTSTLIKWDRFCSALINDNILLLYSSEVKFNIFPRRCFTDSQFEQLTRLVRQNIVTSGNQNI